MIVLEINTCHVVVLLVVNHVRLVLVDLLVAFLLAVLKERVLDWLARDIDRDVLLESLRAL